MDEQPQDGSNKLATKESTGQLETPKQALTIEDSSSITDDPSGIELHTASSSPKTPEKRELLLHNEFIEIPNKLFQSEEFFRSVINKEAFYTLSESARTHLIKNFLPHDMTSNMDDTLDFIFSKSPSVSFVPPLTNVYNRVQAGFYNRPHGSDCVQLRDFHKVLHNHFIRNYHMKLLRHLVRARHQILENACKQGASEKITPRSRPSRRKLQRDEKLQKRSKKRIAMMLSKVSEIVGVEDAPSSDESGSENSRIPLTMFREAESTLYNPLHGDCDLDLHQPTELSSVKQLLHRYKKLREKNPECPSLDISDITLEGIYDRVGLSYQSEKNYAQQRWKKQKEQEALRETAAEHI